MQKKPLLKTSLEFLKKGFPENLLATKSYTKKQKRLFLKENTILLKKLHKKIKKRLRKEKTLLLKNLRKKLKKKLRFPESGFDTLLKTVKTDLRNKNKINIEKQKNTLSPVNKLYRLKQRAALLRATTSKKLKSFAFRQRRKGRRKVLFFRRRQKVLFGGGQQKKKICFLLSPDQIRKNIFNKQIQYRRSSDFLLKLKERKKLYILYGNLSKKFFQNKYKQAHNYQGKRIENFLTLLETRLDVVLYRICFFKNIYSARQSINHNQVLVNGKILNIPTYKVNPGDVISVASKKKKVIASQILQYVKKRIFRRRRRFLRYSKKYKKKSKLSYKFKWTTRYNPFKKNFNILWARLARKLNFFVRCGIYRRICLSTNIKKLKLITNKINQIKAIYFLKNLPLSELLLRRSVRRKRSRPHILASMRITPMKPLNMEASFKLLTAIVLYSPQKLVFPSLFHTDFTYGSFAASRRKRA